MFVQNSFALASVLRLLSLASELNAQGFSQSLAAAQTLRFWLQVRLEWPTDLAINPMDNSIYVLDNNVVLQITENRQVASPRFKRKTHLKLISFLCLFFLHFYIFAFVCASGAYRGRPPNALPGARHRVHPGQEGGADHARGRHRHRLVLQRRALHRRDGREEDPPHQTGSSLRQTAQGSALKSLRAVTPRFSTRCRQMAKSPTSLARHPTATARYRRGFTTDFTFSFMLIFCKPFSTPYTK